jgi:myo-inositol-1(or 4)-monophosphatase
MYDELLEIAISAARAGAAALVRRFRAPGLTVHSKGKNDLVSLADYESEAAIVETIRRAFPDHAVLSEEGGSLRGSPEAQWIVDPLDGTSNFVQGLPVFAVSIACRWRGELVVGVILDPSRDDLFTAAAGSGARRNAETIRVSSQPHLGDAFLATGFPFRAHAAIDVYLKMFREVFLGSRGIRRCGAAALDLAHTAAGIYDGFFELRLAPWDVAAGSVLVREAGGCVSDLDGGEGFLDSGNIVAGGAAVFESLRRLIAAHASDADVMQLVPGAEVPPAVPSL